MEKNLTMGEKIELGVLAVITAGIGIGCVYLLFLFLQYLYMIGH